MKRHYETDKELIEQIRVILADNGLNKLNFNIVEATIRLYYDRVGRTKAYQGVLKNPIPYLVFLLAILEVKKLHPTNPYI